jgi:signal peptidase I
MTAMGTLLPMAWRGLQTVLWIVLLAFLALVALSRFTPFEALVVRSGSMAPTIATGSAIIVDRADLIPTIGAVATFRESDGTVVTHRIVAIEGGRLVTRGDANRADDGTTRSPASMYGTVVAVVPMAGYLIHTLQQPAAFLLLLLGSGGLLVLGALRTLNRELIMRGLAPGWTDAE